MKTLIKRMKVEDVAKLEKARELYPISVGALMKELESKSFYTDLTYDVIGIMVSHLCLRNYEPVTINSVFND